MLLKNTVNKNCNVLKFFTAFSNKNIFWNKACYELNVSPDSYAETLIPNVMVSGDGAFEK